MATSEETSDGQRRRRLVLFPCPLQGHINPMLQLAALLHSRGFSITIIHTTFNAPDPSKYPEFTFSFIQAEAPSTKDNAQLILACNATIEEPLRDRLEKMAVAPGEVPVCLIMDALMYTAKTAAEKVGLPRIALRTGGAACLNVYLSLPMLWEKGYFPIQHHESEAPVLEIPPFRVRDLPDIKGSNPYEVYKLFSQMVEGLKSARALILNTIEAVETSDFEKLRRNLPFPVYPVGPLHLFSPNTRGSIWTEDNTCIEWLNQQKSPKSVLYVSFGSLACMDRKELLETAWGLIAGGRPFLWVLRHDSVRGGTTALPREFEEAMGKRGKVVLWAPQQEVLQHPAVGGFWTHCGWNSTMESICEGVPMMCWPCFADQMVNARFVAHIWKVGILFEKRLVRDEIEKGVRRLMVEDEGEQSRMRALEMKAQAKRCVANGGTSQVHLENLVELILSI